MFCFLVVVVVVEAVHEEGGSLDAFMRLFAHKFESSFLLTNELNENCHVFMKCSLEPASLMLCSFQIRQRTCLFFFCVL